MTTGKPDDREENAKGCGIFGAPIVLDEVARAAGLDEVTHSRLCARCATAIFDDMGL